MTNSISAAALAVTLVGCLPGPGGPRPGAVSTGDRLAVVDDVKTWTTQYQEKTGETDVKDADGNVVYTKEHYQTRNEQHAKKIWYPVQGREQINDEDLFKLSKDDAALKATQDMHSTGRTYATVGVAGMLIGIGGMIAGKFIGEGGSLSIGLYSGGAIVGLVGAYGYYRGYEMQSPDEHAVDRSVAETAAQRYNAQLGRGASLTLLNRQF